MRYKQTVTDDMMNDPDKKSECRKADTQLRERDNVITRNLLLQIVNNAESA